MLTVTDMCHQLMTLGRLRTGSEVCYGIPSNPIEYWASIEMKWNCEYITRKFVGSDPIEPLKMLHAAMEKDFNATTTEKAPY